MKNKQIKALVIGLAVTVFLGLIALVIDNYQTVKNVALNETAPAQEIEDPKVREEAMKQLSETRKNSNILKVSESDFTMGEKTAPVVFIEYASLSCPHCAAFTREAFDKLKADYIDTGKVLFIFRHFPLNQSALTASMYSLCQAQDNSSNASEVYFSTIKALYKTQDSWAFDQNSTEKLETIAKLDGMSSERFKSCINDKALQEKVLSERMRAGQELQLRSAPSFFVNGEISEGYVDYETIKTLIEKKLSEAK